MAKINDFPLRLIEAKSTTRANIIQEVAIPGGYPVLVNSGSSSDAISLTGSIRSQLDIDAVIHQNQFLELVTNPQFVYLSFDRAKTTYDGWYLVNSGGASVRPAIFGSYPFTFSARKVKGDLATYFSAGTLENDFSVTPLQVVGLPSGIAYTSPIISIPSESGPVYIKESSAGVAGVYLFEQPDFDLASFYNGQCVVWDDNNGNPFRVYGGNHNFAGDAEINNGLIKLYYDATLKTIGLSIWDGVSAWVALASEFQLHVDASEVAVPQTPTIKSISINEAVFTVNFVSSIGYATATFTLRKGAFYAKVELSTVGGATIHGNTSLVTDGTITGLYNGSHPTNGLPGIGVSKDNSSNYGGALLSNGHTMGFLYSNDSPSGAGFPGYPPGGNATETRWGRTMEANEVKVFGIFASLVSLPHPPPGPLKAGQSFLGNSNFTYVLVNQ